MNVSVRGLVAASSTPPIRDNLNRALVFADGDFTTLVTQALSAVLLPIAVAALLLTALPEIRRQRARLG